MDTVKPAATMYTTGQCQYCAKAKFLLRSKGWSDINEVRVDLDPTRLDEMIRKTGRRSVPQIWLGERHVGGFDDLSALAQAGELG